MREKNICQLVSQWVEENRRKKEKRKRRRWRKVIGFFRLFLLVLSLPLVGIWLKSLLWSPSCPEFNRPLSIKLAQSRPILKESKPRARIKPRNHLQKPTPFKPQKGSATPYLHLLKKYFPHYAWEKAIETMRRESGFNPKAENKNRDGSWDRGLFQINEKTWPSYTKLPFSKAFNPEINIKIASLIFKARGWKAWRVWQ